MSSLREVPTYDDEVVDRRRTDKPIHVDYTEYASISCVLDQGDDVGGDILLRLQLPLI
jgi:hypothetical protein